MLTISTNSALNSARTTNPKKLRGFADEVYAEFSFRKEA
jgi:hypothetical protein